MQCFSVPTKIITPPNSERLPGECPSYEGAGITGNVPLKEDDFMTNKATEKENRIWDLSSKVFNYKKTILCYPASSVLSGKQMCTLLVLSGTVWMANSFTYCPRWKSEWAWMRWSEHREELQEGAQRAFAET